jgi:uncharacterized protein
LTGGHVTSTVTDNLEGLFDSLPVLRIGEAIIVGEAVHLPIRSLIDPPPKNRRPDSSDPIIYNDGPGGWNRRKERSDYKEMISMWRLQESRSSRIVSIKEEIMNRMPVDSSNIASIGYDPISQTLEVEFMKGNIYQYFDVPSQVYEGFITADSKGKYLASQIKGNYRFTRI